MTDEPTATTQPVESVTIEATIIRADGTVEHLGTVSYWHRNPLRRLWWRLTQGESHGNARQ